MSTENGLQAISPLRRLSILSLRSRNSVHVSQDEILLLDDCRRVSTVVLLCGNYIATVFECIVGCEYSYRILKSCGLHVG
jgi:hypothetical protein